MAYLMLKRNEPYRYARPELMVKKFTELGGANSFPLTSVPSNHNYAPVPVPVWQRSISKLGYQRCYRRNNCPLEKDVCWTSSGLPIS